MFGDCHVALRAPRNDVQASFLAMTSFLGMTYGQTKCQQNFTDILSYPQISKTGYQFNKYL